MRGGSLLNGAATKGQIIRFLFLPPHVTVFADSFLFFPSILSLSSPREPHVLPFLIIARDKSLTTFDSTDSTT